MTHRHAIEKRSEEILVTLFNMAIASSEARVIEAFGVGSDTAHYPAVTCYCVSAEEEVSQTGIYRARCEVHIETYRADDTAGASLAELVGKVRQQVQSNLEMEATSDVTQATIHRILLSDSNSTVDGNVRRVEIGVDLIWSPID